jgi:hypothetical protein
MAVASPVNARRPAAPAGVLSRSAATGSATGQRRVRLVPTTAERARCAQSGKPVSPPRSAIGMEEPARGAAERGNAAAARGNYVRKTAIATQMSVARITGNARLPSAATDSSSAMKRASRRTLSFDVISAARPAEAVSPMQSAHRHARIAAEGFSPVPCSHGFPAGRTPIAISSVRNLRPRAIPAAAVTAELTLFSVRPAGMVLAMCRRTAATAAVTAASAPRLDAGTHSSNPERSVITEECVPPTEASARYGAMCCAASASLEHAFLRAATGVPLPAPWKSACAGTARLTPESSAGSRTSINVSPDRSAILGHVDAEGEAISAETEQPIRGNNAGNPTSRVRRARVAATVSAAAQSSAVTVVAMAMRPAPRAPLIAVPARAETGCSNPVKSVTTETP